MKFYRLIYITAASLLMLAAVAHGYAGARTALMCDVASIASIAILYVVFRFPRRLVYRVAQTLAVALLLAASFVAWDAAIGSTLVWSAIGTLSGIAALGSVSLAMLLGHWYLVVRGMSIDPLKRLTVATGVSVAIRVVVVIAAAVLLWTPEGFVRGTAIHRLVFTEGMFFWMRVGWGLLAPLALLPMIWGTVKLRSTMAATGILYVAVVAVIIGEVLGLWLSAMFRVPL